MKWNLIKTDGNPKEKGTYLCVLLYDEYYNDKKTGKKLACIDFRYFGDAEGLEGWIMTDQPQEGLVWTEQVGSAYGEIVYAWREFKVTDAPELPEGYAYDRSIF